MRVGNTSGLIPSGVGDRGSDKRGYEREREREKPEVWVMEYRVEDCKGRQNCDLIPPRTLLEFS
jgi:hypothetical protein